MATNEETAVQVSDVKVEIKSDVKSVKSDKEPKTPARNVLAWMQTPTMSNALASALAGYMDLATFNAACFITAQNPELAKCGAESMFRAFMEVAQMGFLPGPHHKHVALIPRNGIITVTPQWQGFKFLMEQQPGILRVTPKLVHVTDVVEYGEDADGEIIITKHLFDPFSSEREFLHPDALPKDGVAGLRGGYLKIDYNDGTPTRYHIVSAAKIHRNRLCAETQKLWIKWFPEQCLKTILRDAWSRRAISIAPELEVHVARAEAKDNFILASIPATTAKTLGAGSADEIPDMAQFASKEAVTVEAKVADAKPVASGRGALGLAEQSPAA